MSYGNINLSMLIAVDENFAIGLDGGLPWYEPEDLKHFQRVARNTICIVGAGTYRTLPKLSHEMVVITKNDDIELKSENHVFAKSIGEALIYVRSKSTNQTATVIGGRDIYLQFLPYVSRIIVSHVKGKFKADTFLPELRDYIIGESSASAWSKYNDDVPNHSGFCVREYFPYNRLDINVLVGSEYRRSNRIINSQHNMVYAEYADNVGNDVMVLDYLLTSYDLGYLEGKQYAFEAYDLNLNSDELVKLSHLRALDRYNREIVCKMPKSSGTGYMSKAYTHGYSRACIEYLRKFLRSMDVKNELPPNYDIVLANVLSDVEMGVIDQVTISQDSIIVNSEVIFQKSSK